MKSKYITIAIQLLFIFGLGIVAIWVTSLFNKEAPSEKVIREIVKEVILKKPSCPDTTGAFLALKDSGQVVTLAKNLNTYGENGAFVNPKITIIKSTTPRQSRRGMKGACASSRVWAVEVLPPSSPDSQRTD